MSNLLLAILCLVLGKVLQRVRQFPESSAQTLNAYVIYIALPALVLVQIPKVPLELHALAPVLCAWIIMGASGAFTWLCARALQWSPTTTGAMLLVTVLGNTTFIGLPLIEAHMGPTALPYAILYDQLGTFIAFNTLGIAIATRYSGGNHASAEPFWRKMVKFPPFGALLVGLVLHFYPPPRLVDEVLQRLAATLVPVVMVAVGMQWRLRIERSEVRLILLALVFILAAKPLFAWGLVSLLHLEPLIAKTIVLEAAMPAMISTGALALMYQLAPRMVSTIIGYSLMLSFVTVWLWSLAI